MGERRTWETSPSDLSPMQGVSRDPHQPPRLTSLSPNDSAERPAAVKRLRDRDSSGSKDRALVGGSLRRFYAGLGPSESQIELRRRRVSLDENGSQGAA